MEYPGKPGYLINHALGVTEDMAPPLLIFVVSHFSIDPFDTSDKRSFLQ
jgi:hypothetical protein